MERPRIHITVQYPIGVPRRHGVDIIAFHGHRIVAAETEEWSVSMGMGMGIENEHMSNSAVPILTASSDSYYGGLFNHDKTPSR
jgi:hypothetical protein